MSTERFDEDEVYRVTVRPGVTSTVGARVRSSPARAELASGIWYYPRMALPPHSQLAVPRSPALLALTIVLCACAGTKTKSTPPPGRHAAHGHAIAMVERSDGDSDVMLERVEDEDTRWVELPHFGECPYEADDIPPFQPVDDGHVPGLDPERSRLTNMDAGEETIHNESLLVLLDHATTEVLECASMSACYDDRALESGSIDLLFEVAPSGDVRGVTVELTPGLDHTGVRECSRLAIWDTEFPAFDGADMVISYRLDID